MQKIFRKGFNFIQTTTMFWARKLTKIIDNKLILDNVDISVEVWEIKIIIWPSWWGKSTLLSCLSNIETPTSWELFMDDIIIPFSHGKKTWNISFQYPKISLLSQWLFLRPHLSVQENIILPLREQWIFDQESFAKIIKKLHIDHLLNSYPLDCSWWERQRVALARSLLLKSKYLLLDEITSALDIEHVQIVVDLLKEIKKETSIILVTHMIHFAKKLGDYIYFMDWWKIIEEGTCEILESPKTDRLKMFLNTY